MKTSQLINRLYRYQQLLGGKDIFIPADYTSSALECLQCRLHTTSLLCQPRSSCCASPSCQQLWSVGFFCGRPCDMELVIRQSERSGHQQKLLQAFT